MLMVSTMKKSLQKKAEKFLYVSTLSIIEILLIYNIFRYIYVFQNIENLNSKPKVIEGTLSKVGLFNESDYFKVNLEDINFNLLNYWEDGEINIYILKDK